LGRRAQCHAVKWLGPVENPTGKSPHLPLYLHIPAMQYKG